MRLPEVDDIVRIRLDLPELAVHRGDVGIVRSKWFAPSVAYEVEFTSDEDGQTRCTRALLLPEQIVPSVAEEETEEDDEQRRRLADVGTFFIG